MINYPKIGMNFILRMNRRHQSSHISTMRRNIIKDKLWKSTLRGNERSAHPGGVGRLAEREAAWRRVRGREGGREGRGRWAGEREKKIDKEGGG